MCCTDLGSREPSLVMVVELKMAGCDDTVGETPGREGSGSATGGLEGEGELFVSSAIWVMAKEGEVLPELPITGE